MCFADNLSNNFAGAMNFDHVVNLCAEYSGLVDKVDAKDVNLLFSSSYIEDIYAANVDGMKHDSVCVTCNIVTYSC